MSANKYHPEWLAFQETLEAKSASGGGTEQIRAVFDQMSEHLEKQWPKLDVSLAVSEEFIKSDNIKVRIYQPESNAGNLPLIIYFHGGGFLSGNLSTEDPHCRILAAKTPAVVVNVDYPLAPEHNMEQIIQSSLHAIAWAKSHNPTLTKSKDLLLAGGSAGGTLALQLAYHFAQNPEPTTAKLTGLILIMPAASPAAITPYAGPYADESTSMKEKGEGFPMLDRQAQLYMIRTPRMDITNPAHFPLLSDRLSGFPRCYIVTADHDPLRDDGKILAKRIRNESGVEVVLAHYKGLPHWFHWFPSLDVAHDMMERTVAGVRWVLGRGEAAMALTGDE